MRRTLPIVILAGTLLGGCYPYQDQYIEDFDAVFTLHAEEGIDYGGYQTFALVDTLYTWDRQGELVPSDSRFGPAVIAELRENLLAAGYTEVSDPFADDPDLVAVARATTTTHVDISYYYPWYGGWYGWYYPYYPVTSVSSYNSGSLVIDLIDPVLFDPDSEQREAVWTMYAAGLFEGSNASIETRIRSAIDQAFSQSPYLQAD